MTDAHVILITIPGLREFDVEPMSSIRDLMACGEIADLVPGFPCLGGPITTNMTTGRRPRVHGITGDFFYNRRTHRFQTTGLSNERVETPQIWDLLSQRDESLTSAVWFAPYAQECGADHICCCTEEENLYTRPVELSRTLTEQLGPFPGVQDEKRTAWIVDSAIATAKAGAPRFFYIRLPYLSTVAEKFGPESDEVKAALVQLDEQLARLIDGIRAAIDPETTTWFLSGEYVVTPVDHVLYPNRILRGAGFLEVREEDGKELIDFEKSKAWAMTDGQVSHVFLKDKDEPRLHQIVGLFAGAPGIDEVVVGAELRKYDLDHANSGDLVLMSLPHSWQAYYWWIDDDHAPDFARRIAPTQKPGYDPVELFAEPGPEKGTGTICAAHPAGPTGKWSQSPFPAPSKDNLD